MSFRRNRPLGVRLHRVGLAARPASRGSLSQFGGRRLKQLTTEDAIDDVDHYVKVLRAGLVSAMRGGVTGFDECGQSLSVASAEHPVGLKRFQARVEGSPIPNPPRGNHISEASHERSAPRWWPSPRVGAVVTGVNYSGRRCTPLPVTSLQEAAA